MHKKNLIAIIGGSIAGCGTALAILKNSHYSVKIFERLPQRLSGQGAGLFLPTPLFETLKHQHYLDANLNAFPITQRHFVIQDSFHPQSGRTIWQQPLSATSVHWNELFKNLRQRIPDDIYLANAEVTHVDCRQSDRSVITFKNGETMEVDLVICADGYSSIGRSLLDADAALQHAGYHAWRGVVPFAKIKTPQVFEQSVPYFLNQQGHLLCYPIWENGQKLLNWVFFEKCAHAIAESFFIDSSGRRHQNFLPPKLLSEYSKHHLSDYAHNALPQIMAEVVSSTEQPFIQRIIDVYMPHCQKNRLIALGDAGTVLRPHVGAGATKALQDALRLGEYLNDAHGSLDQSLEQWNEKQTAESKELYTLSHSMGEGLVLNPPEWNTMNEQTMAAWWQGVLAGEKWYPTGNGD